jgi:hypothetical protein
MDEPPCPDPDKSLPCFPSSSLTSALAAAARESLHDAATAASAEASRLSAEAASLRARLDSAPGRLSRELAESARDTAAAAHAEAARLRARLDEEVADVLRSRADARAAWERYRGGGEAWRVLARAAAGRVDVEFTLFCGSVANCAAAGVACVAVPVVYAVTSQPGEDREGDDWRRFRRLRCALWTATSASVSLTLALATNAGWDAYAADDDDLALAYVFGAPVVSVLGIFGVSNLVDWLRPAKDFEHVELDNLAPTESFADSE